MKNIFYKYIKILKIIFQNLIFRKQREPKVDISRKQKKTESGSLK